MTTHIRTPTAAGMKSGRIPATAGTVRNLLTDVTRDGRLSRSEVRDVFTSLHPNVPNPASTLLGQAMLCGLEAAASDFVSHQETLRHASGVPAQLRHAASTLFGALRRKPSGEPVSGADIASLRRQTLERAVALLGGSMQGSCVIFGQMAIQYPNAFTASPDGGWPLPKPDVRAAYEDNLAHLFAGKVDENAPFAETWAYLAAHDTA